MKTRHSNGFTLIELLVVLLILVSLLGIALISVQTMGTHWRKSAENQREMYTKFKSVSLIDLSIRSVLPYEVANKKGVSGFYFLGRREGFTAVTSNGIYNAGKLSVFRVLKELQEDGRFSLYYEEANLGQFPLVQSEQQLDFNFRLLVLKNIQVMQFQYFGWKDKQAFNDFSAELVLAEDKIWHNEFDGMEKGLHPERIAINIDGFTWYVDLSNAKEQFLRRRSAASDDV